MQSLRVGELAKRAGVSVRALHHYDRIGLLSPARRSEAGYRLYSAGDIRRLQQIRSLQQIGLPLDQIRCMLDRQKVSPLAVVELQLTRLREQIAREQCLLDRLQQIAERLKAAAEVSIDDVLTTLETMHMIEKHYTPEQLRQLRERADQIGQERIQTVEAMWPQLIEEVRAALDGGADPASEQAQRLAERWMALMQEFSGGDPEIERAAASVMREMQDTAHPAADPRMADYMAYIGKARAARSDQTT